MAIKNYLTLVNDAIRDGGIDADPLTLSNFASPPENSIYEKMKNWVAEAWNQIQLDLDEWEFTNDTAHVLVSPRLILTQTVSSVTGTDEIVPGVTIVGETSGFTAIVDAVEYLSESSTTAIPEETRVRITYHGFQGTGFLVNEFVSISLPTPSAAGNFRMIGYGSYSTQELVPDAAEINLSSFRIQDGVGINAHTHNKPPAVGVRPMFWIPLNQWRWIDFNSYHRGSPTYFTIMANGEYQFYPHPDQDYIITMDYTRQPQVLTDPTDEPLLLPSELHAIIYWRALMFYGEYDERPAVLTKAQKNYMFYRYKMEKRLHPHITFQPSLYNTWNP